MGKDNKSRAESKSGRKSSHRDKLRAAQEDLLSRTLRQN
jgi:hypothetical protein